MSFEWISSPQRRFLRWNSWTRILCSSRASRQLNRRRNSLFSKLFSCSSCLCSSDPTSCMLLWCILQRVFKLGKEPLVDVLGKGNARGTSILGMLPLTLAVVQHSNMRLCVLYLNKLLHGKVRWKTWQSSLFWWTCSSLSLRGRRARDWCSRRTRECPTLSACPFQPFRLSREPCLI